MQIQAFGDTVRPCILRCIDFSFLKQTFYPDKNNIFLVCLFKPPQQRFRRDSIWKTSPSMGANIGVSGFELCAVNWERTHCARLSLYRHKLLTITLSSRRQAGFLRSLLVMWIADKIIHLYLACYTQGTAEILITAF